MIHALLMRRIWLWKNRLIPSIIILLAMPVCIYSIVSLSFKNIMGQSIIGIPYELWMIPGIAFIISSFGIFPALYRDYFDLRIHKKVLVNVALAPFRKRVLISGYLLVAGMEAIILAIISLFIMSWLVSYPLTWVESVVLLLCLIIYLFILGNLFISLGLLFDTPTTLFLITAITFVFILFGNGFLIEFDFYPLNIGTFLSWQPFSIPFQVFQIFFRTGLFKWQLLVGSILLGILWTLVNTIILKRRLIH